MSACAYVDDRPTLIKWFNNPNISNELFFTVTASEMKVKHHEYAISRDVIWQFRGYVGNDQNNIATFTCNGNDVIDRFSNGSNLYFVIGNWSMTRYNIVGPYHDRMKQERDKVLKFLK